MYGDDLSQRAGGEEVGGVSFARGDGGGEIVDGVLSHDVLVVLFGRNGYEEERTLRLRDDSLDIGIRRLEQLRIGISEGEPGFDEE